MNPPQRGQGRHRRLSIDWAGHEGKGIIRGGKPGNKEPFKKGAVQMDPERGRQEVQDTLLQGTSEKG